MPASCSPGSVPAGAESARIYIPGAPPLGPRLGDRPFIICPPAAELAASLPIGRQVGPHLRDRPTHPFSSLRSPPRALRGWRYLCEPSLSPKPEPDRYAQVTWTACALSPPLAARGAAGLLGDSFSLNAHVALDCVCGPTGPHWV